MPGLIDDEKFSVLDDEDFFGPEKQKRGVVDQSQSESRVEISGIITSVIVVVIFGLFFLWMFSTIQSNADASDQVKQQAIDFAQTFESSERANGATIHLGRQGHPVIFSDNQQLPEGWNGANLDIPRVYQISGCSYFTLSANSSHVYALTNFSDVDQITVWMPIKSSGAVNVCSEAGFTIPVILWAN